MPDLQVLGALYDCLAHLPLLDPGEDEGGEGADLSVVDKTFGLLMSEQVAGGWAVGGGGCSLAVYCYGLLSCCLRPWPALCFACHMLDCHMFACHMLDCHMSLAPLIALCFACQLLIYHICSAICPLLP